MKMKGQQSAHSSPSRSTPKKKSFSGTQFEHKQKIELLKKTLNNTTEYEESEDDFSELKFLKFFNDL